MDAGAFAAQVGSWSVYAWGNPVAVLRLAGDEERAHFGKNLCEWLLHPQSGVIGNRQIVEDLWNELGFDALPPAVIPAVHAFPVLCESPRMGMMVPLRVEPAHDWNVWEGFRTFGGGSPTARAGLVALLEQVARCWRQVHGTVLPVRWRRALSVDVCLRVHMDAIEGRSYQVPLCLAVLRALGSTTSAALERSEPALGPGPVFATGSLGEEGNFGPVKFLEEKLEAFLREYGDGWPAVLTQDQERELAGSGLLDRVRVLVANDLRELLSLRELHGPLQALMAPPSRVELDAMLDHMEHLERSVRFGDADQLSSWLLPEVESPYQTFRLRRYAAQSLMNRGQFASSRQHLIEAVKLLNGNPTLFSRDAHGAAGCLAATLAIDSAQPQAGLDELRPLLEKLDTLSAEMRIKLLGELCQLLRMLGRHEEAIDAGKRAVALADVVSPGESGRSRNYLIHAHIERIRCGQGTEHDLRRATELLAESLGVFAPQVSPEATRSHRGFCLHYEAELARLQGRQFVPPARAPHSGVWGHAWQFVLLSCARNAAHSLQARLDQARRLVAESAREGDERSLFVLLHHVYRLVLAELEGGDNPDARNQIRLWCARHTGEGEPGWQQRLSGAEDRDAGWFVSRIPFF